MSVYVTTAGDVVDRVAWAKLGDVQQAHVLLAANPHLERYGPVLPAGVEIVLPAPVAAPARRAVLRLWGVDR